MKIVRPVGDQNIWGETVQNGAHLLACLREIAHLTVGYANKRHLSTHDGRATLGFLSPYRVLGCRHVHDTRLIPALDMLADGAPSPDLGIIRMGHDRH
jgi:hypothetical protein